MSRLPSVLASLAIATFASAPALADCIPGTGLCASAGASVGLPIPNVNVGGQVTVGIPLPTIVFPGAAPQAAPAPPPQVVVVPGYPQYPAYQPPPAVYYQPAAPRAYYQREPYWGASRLGIDLRVDGAAGFGANRFQDAYGMGGAGIGLRYRATPHFGVELGMDVVGGRDYNDNKRLEVSGNLGGLLFVNPRSRVQLYFSGGVLVDHSKASLAANTSSNALQASQEIYDHVGGYAGLGLEMFATRHLSFHLDARGVVRQNVSDGAPEFTEAGTGRTTNTSGGVVGQAGMVFYF
jgi:hypothetical protein